MKKYLKLFIAPLAVLAFFLLLSYFWKLLHLPEESVLIPVIKKYFDLYGIWVVFLAAMIESGFVIGIYLPGGLVIFLGVIFTIGHPLQTVAVVASVIVGFIIGFTIDFYIGKFGWYKLFLHFGLGKTLEKTKDRIQKYGLSIPWLGYHHPDFGSILATAYGVLNYPYRKFLRLSILPISAWCVFWAALAYFLGEAALKMLGYKSLAVIIGVWIIARIIELKLEQRKELV